jgi:hypothetical protein
MADPGKVSMNALSAADAISPAIERTKRYLFRPFQWGPYLKICTVALVTEGFSANFSSSTPGHASHAANTSAPFAFTPAMVAAIIAGIAAAIVIAFLVFYLVTRLRFALFHCLIHQTKEIKPGWRLYREQANRFFKLNLVIGLIFIGCVALIALPFVFKFMALYRTAGPGHHVNVFQFISLVFPLILVFLVLVLLAFATDIVLRDFMLPHFALENASAQTAWQSVRSHLAAERGSFLFFALLRLLLPAVAFMALLIALAIPALIVFGILGMVFAAFHGMTTDGTGVFPLLGTFFEVCIGLIAVGLALFAAICLGGPLSIGLRNYALLFYGSRYLTLGNILYPPQPPADLGTATT